MNIRLLSNSLYPIVSIDIIFIEGRIGKGKGGYGTLHLKKKACK